MALKYLLIILINGHKDDKNAYLSLDRNTHTHMHMYTHKGREIAWA